ncbi:MAG: hypothetical protein M5U01_19545 [Ardenticatenaceae bacterium]|nr:hypothetical protein [Ardenticatenaceae bacterium]
MSSNKAFVDLVGVTCYSLFDPLSRMKDENAGSGQPRFNAVAVGAVLSWLEILAELWKMGRQIARGLATEGMYEVLEHESTLELVDRRGERATFRKRQKVRYVQDNIIAYQDQAWGDGEILLNYRCTPGVPVDMYRPGQKTYILISLRGVKNRGDVDVFNIEWGMSHGFTRSTELWDTEVSHRTKRLKIQVIFPKSRPPLRAWLITDPVRQTHLISEDAQIQLPDGRWLVSWERRHPRLHGHYTLKWDW